MQSGKLSCINTKGNKASLCSYILHSYIISVHRYLCLLDLEFPKNHFLMKLIDNGRANNVMRVNTVEVTHALTVLVNYNKQRANHLHGQLSRDDTLTENVRRHPN